MKVVSAFNLKSEQTYDVRDAAKRLLLLVLGCFVLVLGHVDRDVLERDITLPHNKRDGKSRGRKVRAVERDNHGGIRKAVEQEKSFSRRRSWSGMAGRNGEVVVKKGLRPEEYKRTVLVTDD